MNGTLHMIDRTIPVIEVSKDGGLTWDIWSYWRSTQEHMAQESCSRLTRIYPEFKFRIAWTAEVVR